MAESFEAQDTRIEGVDGEQWARWLVSDKKEIEDIGNPDLELELRLLARRPNEFTDARVLQESHERIEKMVREKTLTLGAAATWLIRIEDRCKIVVEREKVRIQVKQEPNAPPLLSSRGESRTEQGPLSEAEKLLLLIEASNLQTFHVQNADASSKLEAIVLDLSEGPKRQIEARLRLHDCFLGVKSALSKGGDAPNPAGGSIPGGLFRQEASELKEKNRLLTPQDFKLLLQQGIPELKIGEAYMALQRAAFVGVNGKKIFALGVTAPEEQQIYKTIVQGLGGDRNAEKSLELAMRVAWATLEVSTWNDDMVGVDPMAEAVYFRAYREGKTQLGGDIGPRVTIPLVEGLGGSYLRIARGVDKTPLHDLAELQEAPGDAARIVRVKILEPQVGTRDAEISVKQLKLLKRIRGYSTVQGGHNLVDVANLNFDKLGTADYETYLAVRTPQILTVKNLLLKTDWKPEDFAKEKVDSWLSSFRFVDPEDKLGFKYYLVLGALHHAWEERRRAISLGWGYDKLVEVRRNLTDVLGTGEDRKPIRFMKLKVFDRIYTLLNLNRKSLITDFLGGFGIGPFGRPRS